MTDTQVVCQILTGFNGAGVCVSFCAGLLRALFFGESALRAFNLWSALECVKSALYLLC